MDREVGLQERTQASSWAQCTQLFQERPGRSLAEAALLLGARDTPTEGRRPEAAMGAGAY